MRLLLHTCCAPCAIYPVSEAKKDNFEVTGFFCNSNIHPQSEYIKRKSTARGYFKSEDLEIIFPTYDAADFFMNKNLRNLVGCGGSGTAGRCRVCWEMRLKETVSFAEANRFDAFTTTLLGSPYQDHGVIKEICEGLSGGKNARFYYRDFRAGFRDAHESARKKDIYCQRYCGCVFSMVEREEKRKSS